MDEIYPSIRASYGGYSQCRRRNCPGSIPVSSDKLGTNSLETDNSA